MMMMMAFRFPNYRVTGMFITGQTTARPSPTLTPSPQKFVYYFCNLFYTGCTFLYNGSNNVRIQYKL